MFLVALCSLVALQLLFSLLHKFSIEGHQLHQEAHGGLDVSHLYDAIDGFLHHHVTVDRQICQKKCRGVADTITAVNEHLIFGNKNRKTVQIKQLCVL